MNGFGEGVGMAGDVDLNFEFGDCGFGFWDLKIGEIGEVDLVWLKPKGVAVSSGWVMVRIGLMIRVGNR